MAVPALALALAPVAQAAGPIDASGPTLISIIRTTGDEVSRENPDARLAVHATDPSGVQWAGVWVATDDIPPPFAWQFSAGIEPVPDTLIDRPIWSYDPTNSANVKPQTLTITRVELLDALGNRTVVTDRAILDPLTYRAVNPLYDPDAPVLESVTVEPSVIRPGEDVTVSAVLRDANAITDGSAELETDNFGETGLDTISSTVVDNGDGTASLRTVFRAREDTPYGSYPVRIFAHDRFYNVLRGDSGAAFTVDDPAHPVGTVAISGKRAVGNTLTAVPTGWDPAATLSYRWTNWGQEFATGPTAQLDGVLMWRDIPVYVTGTWPDGTIRTRRIWTGDIASGTLPVPPPEITTSATVDRPLTYRQDDSFMKWDWRDRGIQWLRDGEPLSSAYTAIYIPSAKDMGHRISVRTTHRQTGYDTLTQDSAAVLVGPGTLKAPTPSVAGTTWRVGQGLKTTPGTWSPGTQLHYQWQRNGINIAGARSRDYTPAGADYETKLRVRVTGTKTGYAQVSRYSGTKTVALGTIVSPTPKAEGTAKVGNRLSAETLGWSRGTRLKHQWQRDGRNIAGATGRTYTLTAADRGKKLRVRIAGAKPGYASVTRYSTARTIGYGILKNANLTVSGTRKVGTKVTIKPVGWTSGTTFTYQWTRDGKKIKGATGRTYTIRAADRKTALFVTVTGSKPGYRSVIYDVAVWVR